ncbi:MAG: indole-3-glycerol phosphate synthase TrpC [Ferruginibacter sp.]
MNILEEIIAYKRTEVETRKILVPEAEVLASELFERKTISLKQILSAASTTGIIAEFKRRSPSKGFINYNADVAAITKDYTKYGAAALSILTDNHFFGGNSEDVLIARDNQIPILRKEFIVDSYQVSASKAIGADVILLIAACLSVKEVKELAAHAKKIGLEVLLEIHNKDEIGHICDEVDMVGINNRNLKTFKVDINHSITLSKLIPQDKIKIAESGIDNMETIIKLKDAGYKGFLIGELFMKEQNPGMAFSNFVNQLNIASNK